MATSSCKAIVQSGPRKGSQCLQQMSLDSDGYCIRHLRQKVFGENKLDKCRNFNRGCSNGVTDGKKTCLSCLNKHRRAPCQHIGNDGIQCNYMVSDEKTKYCGKHQRDMFKDYEKENTVKLCNIERGCMNVCDPEFVSCKSCIINDYIVNNPYHSNTIDNKNHCVVCDIVYIPTTVCDAIKMCSDCYMNFMNDRKTKKVVQQRAYSDMTIDKYYEAYMRGAFKRTNTCEFHLSLLEFTELVMKPCYYCETLDEHKFNGIDRVDNNGHYTIENTVPCCSVCNRIKYTMMVNEFINKCYAIHVYQSTGKSITYKLMESFPSYKSLSIRYYSDYKKTNDEQSSRKLEFALSKSEFNSLRTHACYLCGIENTDDHYNGIDRVDNSKGYIISNCRACCGHCNFFKNVIPLGIVKHYSSKIVANGTLSHHLVTFTGSEEELATNNITIDTVSVSRFSTKHLASLFVGPIDNVINYCTLHGRTITFIRNVQKLYELRNQKTDDEIQLSLVRYVNIDKNKKYITNKAVEMSNDTKHHKKVNDVLTMLEQGKLEEYVHWHNQHIGDESTVFHKHLYGFVNSMNSMTVHEKVDMCRRILKQEQNRRGAKRASDKLKELKPILQLSPNESVPIIKHTKPFHVVNVDTIMPQKPNIIEHIAPDSEPILKQWKSRDVYNIINANNSHLYKSYCENNNDISKISEWTSLWSNLVANTAGQSWEYAETHIRSFVETLRRYRHNQLCETKRNVVDRADRQIWPAETVAKLYNEGRITEYKSITETYAGDNPEDIQWQKRWAEFVGSLEKAQSSQNDIVKIISRFMTAQRTKKYRRTQQ